MSLVSELLERAVGRLQTSPALDRPADAAQKVTGALPPGPVKDLLSGTALGHPVHPLLVTVPIGAFTSAAVLDLLGGESRAARRLIGLGILSSLPTALSGASDWSDTAGAERRVGLVHAAGNTLALALLSASWLARRSEGRGKVLTLAGLGLVGASGWLGGHLSYALGVGVDTTAFSSMPQEWTDVAGAADVVEGKPYPARAGDLAVLLVRQGDVVRAMADRCTHRGGPLSEGPVVGDCVECPWHGSRFRLSDGQVERGPATRPQPVLRARVRDGRVEVCRDEAQALRTNTV
jgi:nitrite reductase/ring-hydroxylating ferredoxin subunit/uncharacterized membrane protein